MKLARRKTTIAPFHRMAEVSLDLGWAMLSNFLLRAGFWFAGCILTESLWGRDEVMLARVC